MFPAPRDTLCKLMVIRVLRKRQDLGMGVWISGRAHAHLCETVGSFSSTATLIEPKRQWARQDSHFTWCWWVRMWITETCDDIFQTGGGAAQEKVPELDGAGSTEQDKSHSNSSTLSDRRLSNSSLCSIEEEHRTVYEMVQRILLSTRGYVNFVNEVFRQVSVWHTVMKLKSSLFLS